MFLSNLSNLALFYLVYQIDLGLVSQVGKSLIFAEKSLLLLFGGLALY